MSLEERIRDLQDLQFGRKTRRQVMERIAELRDVDVEEARLRKEKS